jgi:hypothetical protein
MGVFDCGLSEVYLEILGLMSDFQAEREGSIPFTRSNVFNVLRPSGCPFRQSRLKHSDKVSRFAHIAPQFEALAHLGGLWDDIDPFDALQLCATLQIVMAR